MGETTKCDFCNKIRQNQTSAQGRDCPTVDSRRL